jgi:hypothetical protein
MLRSIIAKGLKGGYNPSMSTGTIRAYNILKARNFSDQEAQDFVDFVESSGKEGLATKEDLAVQKTELIKWIIGVGATVGILVIGAVASLFKLYFQH